MVTPGFGDGPRLREVDRLERKALVSKDRPKLTSDSRRTEDHVRPQQQRGNDSFDAQDVRYRMTTLHVDHRRDDESRLRQVDIIGQRQHEFARHGPRTGPRRSKARSSSRRGLEGKVGVADGGQTLGVRSARRCPPHVGLRRLLAAR